MSSPALAHFRHSANPNEQFIPEAVTVVISDEDDNDAFIEAVDCCDNIGAEKDDSDDNVDVICTFNSPLHAIESTWHIFTKDFLLFLRYCFSSFL